MYSINTLTEYIRHDIEGKYSRAEKVVLLKYHKALLTLDKSISKLELTSKVRAELQNSINFFIEAKLVKSVRESNNREKTFELIKDETKRIKEETSHVKGNQRYSATMTRSDAEEVLSHYMSEEEIPYELLEVYPETQEELEKSNSLAPGSIVKAKRLVRTIKAKEY